MCTNNNMPSRLPHFCMAVCRKSILIAIKQRKKPLFKHLFYDNAQVARKLAMVEADLERAEERAELGEKQVLDVTDGDREC